jgi:phenazine biosynthesis protein PhzF family
MQEIDFYLVDAFSDRPFAGNSAAVCILDTWLPDPTLLKMAQQHNQSETAFVVRQESGFELRWFTTQQEVNLCGHATLATAYVVFEHLQFPDKRVRFETASGQLTVSREGEWLTLDFPTGETQPAVPPQEMLAALGISQYVNARKGRAWVIELESRQQVEAVKPDISAMTPVEHKVAITARGEGDYDFVSRFFSPGEAVWEDPVTGSSHTMLIPYWGEKLGKTHLFARQVSARGGDIRCEWQGNRVLMSGKASLYLKGTLFLPDISERWVHPAAQ